MVEGIFNGFKATRPFEIVQRPSVRVGGGFSSVVINSGNFFPRRRVGAVCNCLSLTIILINEELFLIKLVERVYEGLLIDPETPFLEQEDKLEVARRARPAYRCLPQPTKVLQKV